MEDDRPIYVQAVERIEQLERELAECRERVRVERQGYDLATQVAAENARQLEMCRKYGKRLFDAVGKAMDEEYELSERTCDLLWEAWCAYGRHVKEER